MIDDINLQIMKILQENARTTNADIARQIGMAPSAVFERIRKMEAQGLIRGYEARLDPQALNMGLTAFVLVRAEERPGSMMSGKQLAEIPEVQEVHHVAGEDCYLVKVRAANTEDMGRLLRERFGAIEAIRSTRTTIVLSTLKETAQLPLKMEKAEEANL